MQMYEIPIEITPEGKLELPYTLMERMKRGQSIRLIALLDDSENGGDDRDWARMTAEQFLAGYADADSIYDTIK